MNLKDVTVGMRVEVVNGTRKGKRGTVTAIVESLALVSFDGAPEPAIPMFLMLLKVPGTTGRDHETHRFQCILVARQIRAAASRVRIEAWTKGQDPARRKALLKAYQELRAVAKLMDAASTSSARTKADALDPVIRDMLPTVFWSVTLA